MRVGAKHQKSLGRDSFSHRRRPRSALKLIARVAWVALPIAGVLGLGASGLLSGCAHEPAAEGEARKAVVCDGRSGAEDRSGYLARVEVLKFLSDVATRNGFSCAELERTIGNVDPQARPLELISKPAEGKTPWHRYRKIFLTRQRAEAGAAYWRANADTLARASAAYHVPPEIIVAIIGVETLYGRNMGTFPVLDTLATLGFDYDRRGEFFRGELEQFLQLLREDNIDFSQAKGSYAGAMGKPQFIPSSYRKYAVDFDGDGRRDLFANDQDIIGSVANYFNKFGWQEGAPVVTEARVDGDAYQPLLARGLEPTISEAELQAAGVTINPGEPSEGYASLFDLDGEDRVMHMVGFHNFYVITRYNRSPLYAMAVYQLAGEIKRTYLDGGLSMRR